MTCDKDKLRGVTPGDLAVVVGTGRSGMAAARLLAQLGAQVRVLERDAAKVPAAFAEWAAASNVSIIHGEHEAAHFAGAAFVVPSPGVPVAKLAPYLPAHGCEVLAEMELAWRQLAGEPVLAVTGTSGKTTTVSLCAAMLQAGGLSVFLGGNIGTPLSEYVLDVASGKPRADVLVIEISSFQLQTCSTFHPRVAVLMNLSENHLDYHADMQEYADAKFRLFRCQDEHDLAILGEGVVELAQSYGLKARQVVYHTTERFPVTQLFGPHNRANMEAAWQAVRSFGVEESAAAKAMAAFPPLENRLERVAEKHGVIYVNDTKCTTVDALRVAINAFEQPVLLLVGGKFKGGDLQGLRSLVQAKVRAVAGFGHSREHFEPAWSDIVPMTWHDTLPPAVQHLAAMAHHGDVVLLAPATASFDLYANYLERGAHFRTVVGELA